MRKEDFGKYPREEFEELIGDRVQDGTFKSEEEVYKMNPTKFCIYRFFLRCGSCNFFEINEKGEHYCEFFGVKVEKPKVVIDELVGGKLKGGDKYENYRN